MGISQLCQPKLMCTPEVENGAWLVTKGGPANGQMKGKRTRWKEWPDHKTPKCGQITRCRENNRFTQFYHKKGLKLIYSFKPGNLTASSRCIHLVSSWSKLWSMPPPQTCKGTCSNAAKLMELISKSCKQPTCLLGAVVIRLLYHGLTWSLMRFRKGLLVLPM